MNCLILNPGQWTKAGNTEALSLFNRAIELDPHFASAYAMAADCYVQRKASDWVADPPHEIAEAERLGRRAAELGKDDAIALCMAGLSLATVVGDLDDGAALIDQALLLNPNLAVAWSHSGWLKVYLGEPEVAAEHLARAMRLSPHDPSIVYMQIGAACANFLAGRYAEALSWAEAGARGRPNFGPALRAFAACSVMAGRPEQAQKRRWRGCGTFIRRSALSISRTCFRSGAQKISPGGKRRCGEPVCRNDWSGSDSVLS